MAKNPLNQNLPPENIIGNTPVTREEVNARARELALIEGRAPPDVSQADYEQAKRELTGESDPDRQEAMLDSSPEATLGDPVPGSIGHQIPESPSEDEDDEGRNESEQLAEKGVEQAERDQVRQASAEAAKKDKRDL